MEKKTKKLQLRKETIAVLNGERMCHVVGGMDANQCVLDGKVYMVGEVVKKDGFIFNCMEGGYWRIDAQPNEPVSDMACTNNAYKTCNCPSIQGETCYMQTCKL